MADLTAADFGALIAERIQAEHVAISARWLERLKGMLSVDTNEVFPTDHLLDHIPTLIQELAACLGRHDEVAARWVDSAPITPTMQALGPDHRKDSE